MAVQKEIYLLGFHAVRARLTSAPETIEKILYDGGRKDARLSALLKLAQKANLKTASESSLVLDRYAKGARHQGVVAIAQPRNQPDRLSDLIDELEASNAKSQWVVLLDGVTDPHNLGAVLRSCDGAGVRAVIAPRDRSAPLTETAMRVSAGASEQVTYLQVTNLARAIEELQQADYQVIGLASEASQSLYETDLSGKIALVFGAEGEGMRRLTRERCDILVRLPMSGSVESLNVSVACGICCYEALRQRQRLGR